MCLWITHKAALSSPFWLNPTGFSLRIISGVIIARIELFVFSCTGSLWKYKKSLKKSIVAFDLKRKQFLKRLFTMSSPVLLMLNP